MLRFSQNEFVESSLHFYENGLEIKRQGLQ